MEDMLYADKEIADELSTLLFEHKAINPIVLDLRGLNSWTDFFVVATVTSGAHLKGLRKHLKNYLAERSIFVQPRRRDDDEEWSFIDLGNVVVHLMTEKARSFYDLERLWGVSAHSNAAPVQNVKN